MYREYFMVCAGEAPVIHTGIAVDGIPLVMHQGPAHDLKRGRSVYRQLANTVKGTDLITQMCSGPPNDLKRGRSVYRQLADIVRGTERCKQLCPGNTYLKCNYEIPWQESTTAREHKTFKTP